MPSTILTGPRAILKVGGKVVGTATGWTLRQQIEYQPHKPLGQITTKEHVPVDYNVNGTVATVRIVGLPLTAIGLFPNPDDLLDGGPEVTMELQDQIGGGTAIATVFGVKFDSSDLNIDGRSIVGEQVSYVALLARDEFTGAKK